MFLKKFNEYLKIVRPDTSANNIISGNIYVDIHGKMEIVNMTKNYRCEINIERQGWFTKVPHKLHGKVVDETGRIRYEIHGKWTEYMDMKNVDTGDEYEIWKQDPRHPQANRYYQFSNFTMNLNYVDDKMMRTLPPTDCRRRLDQRYMEEGKYDEAVDEKLRLEEKQRAARKEKEKAKLEHKP